MICQFTLKLYITEFNVLFRMYNLLCYAFVRQTMNTGEAFLKTSNFIFIIQKLNNNKWYKEAYLI